MAEKCVRCKNVNDRPDKAICTACNDKQKKERLEKEEFRRKHGLCVRCGGPISESRYITCHVCLSKQSIRRNKDRVPNKRKKKQSEVASVELMEQSTSSRKPQTPVEREKHKREMAEILQKCREEGISYGQYMAREYLKQAKAEA